MNVSFVRKVEKAKDYALQKERVSFASCKIRFSGDNGDHTVSYEAGGWDCDCDYRIGRDTYAHIMALQMMFQGMVSEAQATA